MTDEIGRDKFEKYVSPLLGALALVGVYLTSFYSYLLFHSLAEVFSAAVAWGIFLLMWNSRRYMQNESLIVLGTAYLFVGFIDLVHTLAYSGMGVFPGYGTNLATQLWVAARYLESLSLLAAPLALGRTVRIRIVFGVYAAVTAAALFAIFGGFFPDCFIDGSGLTPFKKVSEYVICVILLGSAAILVKRRERFDARVLRLVLASIVTTIASEVAFTLYASPYAVSNLLGHLLKIISFYLIYRAVIVVGLREPYRLLFRELKESEEALRESEGRYRELSQSLEQTVRQKVDELRQAESLAALGQMVSMVAHEFRNPLHNIQFGAEELRRRLQHDELGLKMLDDIKLGATMLNETVGELLEYSRQVRLERSLWRVRELVDNAVNLMKDKLSKVAIKIELDSDQRQISVDPVKMTRVLVNLLSNAVEAMPEGGEIRIWSRYTNEGSPTVKLCVSDTGCGIAEENIERIQQPFFTTKARGTGLGVPICKKIVEAHNGMLAFRSKLNEGTTVEISLPGQG
jgi:signal transduction histidine kinase